MIRILAGILLGMGGAGMVEASLDTAGLVLGVCLSLLGALSILWRSAA
jgi:hypothetical protein